MNYIHFATKHGKLNSYCNDGIKVNGVQLYFFLTIALFLLEKIVNMGFTDFKTGAELKERGQGYLYFHVKSPLYGIDGKQVSKHYILAK